MMYLFIESCIISYDIIFSNIYMYWFKDFKMSFFLRQRWYDYRLAYAGRFNFSKVELDTRVMNSVWIPDLYVKNEKKSEIHAVTVPNKLMHLYPDGQVVYSMRYAIIWWHTSDPYVQ